jgi:glycosyltransferase involved in cell wall biosynthesis
MRILVFCDEDLGVAGGGARQVLELARGLVSRGHELRIVAPSPRETQEAEHALRTLCLRPAPVLRGPGLRPLSYLVSSAAVLGWNMIRWRPDVLLWFDAPGQFSPLLVARTAGCPYVLFVNGLPAEELQGVWGWARMRAGLTAALRRAAQGAAAVVSICAEIPNWMQTTWGIPAERCHVIRNGVDAAQFHPEDVVQARRALGLEQAGPYVGFVGGFFPWHGLEVLVEAVPAVLRVRPRVRFLLVGDGQTRRALEARVRELGLEQAVRFPGRVRYEEVPRWIAACDLCLVLHRPTRFYPGDSMKLWEYLACGRPVVATAGVGYGDLVEALGCGQSVKPEDPVDLANGLLRLLDDPAGWARMGERGRAAVVQTHTWDARAAQLEALLIEAAGHRSHRP